MLYCFLDTNIFLQFTTFDEVDWHKVFNVKEICLVIPHVVIQELDKHKYDPKSNRLRERSRMILNKIEGVLSSPDQHVRSGVTLQVLVDNPNRQYLTENGYDPDNPDDRLVGSVALFIQQMSGVDVVLITDDTGPRLKARTHGINTITPPDELHLSEEPDPLQKELNQVKRQLAHLQNSQPKLVLGFRHNDEIADHLIFQVDFHDQMKSADEIERAISTQREALTYKGRIAGLEQVDDSAIRNLHRTIAEGMIGSIQYPTKEEVEVFHQNVEKYLQGSYQQHLEKLEKHETYRARTFPITLVLSNDGSAPADEIDISVYFSDGFVLTEDFIPPPVVPDPPEMPQPKSPYDFSKGLFRSSDLLIPPVRNFPSAPLSPPKSSGFTIRKVNSYIVENDYDRLKQHFEWELPALYITFIPPEKLPKVFPVTYSLSAANIPDLTEGTLRIHLEEKTE